MGAERSEGAGLAGDATPSGTRSAYRLFSVTHSRRAIVGRSARVPLRQRAQVKRRALPEPWSEQAAPEPQGVMA